MGKARTHRAAAITVVGLILICSFLLQLVPLAIVYADPREKFVPVSSGCRSKLVGAARFPSDGAFAIILSPMLRGKGYREADTNILMGACDNWFGNAQSVLSGSTSMIRRTDFGTDGDSACSRTSRSISRLRALKRICHRQ